MKKKWLLTIIIILFFLFSFIYSQENIQTGYITYIKSGHLTLSTEDSLYHLTYDDDLNLSRIDPYAYPIQDAFVGLKVTVAIKGKKIKSGQVYFFQDDLINTQMLKDALKGIEPSKNIYIESWHDMGNERTYTIINKKNDKKIHKTINKNLYLIENE